jgi:hypothetical protein
MVEVDGKRLSVLSDHGIDHIFSNFDTYNTWEDTALSLLSPLMIEGMKVSRKNNATGFLSNQIIVNFEVGLAIVINVDTAKAGYLFFSNGYMKSESFLIMDLVENIKLVIETEMEKFVKIMGSLTKIVSGLSAKTIDQGGIFDKLITIDAESVAT